MLSRNASILFFDVIRDIEIACIGSSILVSKTSRLTSNASGKFPGLESLQLAPTRR